jgi:geranylgeranyl reductase family protein
LAATTTDADVIVVGAGPAGSTAAFHLAQAGIDVLLLEKAEFPREKVCGDGLTPRAVRQLVAMGIDTRPEAGWIRNRGLRILGGGMRLELPWPDLATFPEFGLVRPRNSFDELLARTAQRAGARLHESTPVTGPVHDERTGRVVGVTAKPAENGAEQTYRAPLVVVADGNSSRFSLALGLRKRADRPMGVAVRRYYRSPRHDDDMLESWLELKDAGRGEPAAPRPAGGAWPTAGEGCPTPGGARSGRGQLLPGYGWIFGVGDGTSNVGLGILNTSEAFGSTDYKAMLARWLDATPDEWGYREDNAVGPARGSALPMAFNRQPHYREGALLIGDAGGMINPFNGEGIAYAMEAGALAAGVAVQALARPQGRLREQALAGYPRALKQAYGGYFTLGRVFVALIGHPAVMRIATRHGLPHPALMRLTFKLLANLTDPAAPDATDRVINGLSRLAPAA